MQGKKPFNLILFHKGKKKMSEEKKQPEAELKEGHYQKVPGRAAMIQKLRECEFKRVAGQIQLIHENGSAEYISEDAFKEGYKILSEESEAKV